MLYPLLLQAGGIVKVIGVDIVIDQLRSVGSDAVAAVISIRMHVGIGRLLRSIYRDRKTAVPCRKLVDVRDDRDGYESVSRFVGLDHKVRGRAGYRCSLSIAAHKVPVESGVARIDLPVIASRAVAAPTYVRYLYLFGEICIEAIVGDAIDFLTYRVTRCGYIHAERGCLRQGNLTTANDRAGKKEKCP